MKTLPLASLVAAGFVLNGCATRTPASHAKEDSSRYLALIRISAEVDGSDRLIFTRHSVKCEHKLLVADDTRHHEWPALDGPGPHPGRLA